MSLTHREHCRGVTFVTAHAQDHSEPDWQTLAASGTTLVIYMGMSRIDTLTQALLQHLPASTPSAIVQWASTPQERRLVCRLDGLAQQQRRQDLAARGLFWWVMRWAKRRQMATARLVQKAKA